MSIIASFSFGNKNEMEEGLNAAVNAAWWRGHEDRLGVLVTRHAFDQFSVSLTSEVPFGTVREQDHA
ncbi:hypothetical protein ABIE37_000406 [Arthrobacter bambusae]|jgi:hypothetical protein|uniref:Uncharacterized protein n=1 Tax=Arthrobacter bambusae TaxID=1338426 RepID=A0ABV2P1L9_9MICC